ncbi:MAG TPA: tyrosine-type recombinase/integrase [Bosea sp. (in: a-proteobacteria)]
MPRPKRAEPHYLQQRAGVYQVCWYDATTKRTRRLGLRTKDYDEALDRYAVWRKNPQAIAVVEGRGEDISVTNALDDYYKEHVTKNVVDTVRQENAIRHLKEFFKGGLLRAVDIPACRSYADARRSGRIGGGARHKGDRAKGSDSTIRRELNVLQAASEHARRWKRIKAENMPTFEAPAEHRVQQEVGFLTPYQIATLIFEAEGALRDFVALTYHWGARRESIETLHVDQVKPTHVNLLKKGERQTKKRKPIVPIYPEIAALLRYRVASAGERKGYLFGESVDFYKPFRALCERLEMPHSNPHVLRHSRASNMLMAGVSIYKVARLIGDTVKTVESTYGHHSVEFLLEA